MSEGPNHHDETPHPADTDVFDEWLDQAAQSKGVSKQELVEDMLSSYWILDELTSLVDESNGDDKSDTPLPHRQTDPDTTSPHESSTGSELGSGSDTPSGPENADREATNTTDVAGLNADLEALRTTIQRISDLQTTALSSQTQSSGPASQSQTGNVEGVEFAFRFADLQRRIDAIDDDVDSLESRHETDLERIKSEFQDLNNQVDEVFSDSNGHVTADEFDTFSWKIDERLNELVESQKELDQKVDREFDSIENAFQHLLDVLDEVEQDHETHVERVSNDLQVIHGRVDELLSDTESYITDEELDELSAVFDNHLSEVRERQDELDRRIDQEFNDIEAAFRHLLQTLDDLDSQLETLTETVEEESQSLDEHVSTRESLATLRREAINRNVRKADCGNCGQTIDLAMLDDPSCPECTAEFTGISTRGWNPFGSATLEAETLHPTSAKTTIDQDESGPPESL